jgi:glycosyltransferase involved in cell wall biosynthesis
MRICLVCVEIFAWGKYGGFGRATRMIGRELAKRGVDVVAVVPRRGDQKPVEELDGIRVYSFKLYDMLTAARLYRMVDADLYHSEEPSFGTLLAQIMAPRRKHIVTFRDPRFPEDWEIEARLPTISRMQVLTNRLYEDNFLVDLAIRRADGLYAASRVVAGRATIKHRLEREPDFLPTPTFVPDTVQKAERPTVCFVARWDRRKRPEMFFDLARSFPDVNFIAVGESRDKAWDRRLREKYADVPNLEMTGFLNQFEGSRLYDILSAGWILINTAAREGLPVSFVEAAAHRCAILSSVDPDEFASRFGVHVRDDDFVSGLKHLLENDRWRALGESAYRHVLEHFSYQSAIDRHLEVYRTLLEQK